MLGAANDSNRIKVRDILGAFLFRGDEVEKKVKVLSGGERNRLALAKMLLSSFNVLVMDEPTNHLDIASKNVLKQALQRFEGTLIIVSHDRDFLTGLTDKVYEFKNHTIKEYLGDIDYYLEQRAVSSFREIEKGEEVKKEVMVEKEKTLSYEEQKERKKLTNQLSKVERQISDLEKEIAQMNTKIQENPTPSLMEQYGQKKAQLDTLMQEWEKIASMISE